MLKHTFYTWLLANLFHPIIFIFFMGVEDGFWHGGMANLLDCFVFVGIFSLGFSLPCLFPAWLILRYLSKSEFSLVAKFFLWLSITALPVVTVAIIFGMIGTIGDMQFVYCGLPGAIAVFCAIVLRFDQFYYLFNPRQINDHEANMV